MPDPPPAHSEKPERFEGPAGWRDLAEEDAWGSPLPPGYGSLFDPGPPPADPLVPALAPGVLLRRRRRAKRKLVDPSEELAQRTQHAGEGLVEVRGDQPGYGRISWSEPAGPTFEPAGGIEDPALPTSSLGVDAADDWQGTASDSRDSGAGVVAFEDATVVGGTRSAPEWSEVDYPPSVPGIWPEELTQEEDLAWYQGDPTSVSVAEAPLPEATDAPPERLTRRERKARQRALTVSAKATVRHLDVASVIKVSLVFYLVILAVVVLASILLWYAADAFGALPPLERSVRTLFDLKTFVLHPAAVAEYTCLGGAVLCVAGVVANAIAAIIYNLIADVVGGVRVRVDSYPLE